MNRPAVEQELLQAVADGEVTYFQEQEPPYRRNDVPLDREAHDSMWHLIYVAMLVRDPSGGAWGARLVLTGNGRAEVAHEPR